MSLFTRSLEKRNRKYLKDVKLQDLNNQYQKAQNDIIRELDLGLISRAETKNKLEEMQNTLREQSGATVLAKQANEIIEPQKEEYKPMTASEYENMLRKKKLHKGDISKTSKEINELAKMGQEDLLPIIKELKDYRAQRKQFEEDIINAKNNISQLKLRANLKKLEKKEEKKMEMINNKIMENEDLLNSIQNRLSNLRPVERNTYKEPISQFKKELNEAIKLREAFNIYEEEKKPAGRLILKPPSSQASTTASTTSIFDEIPETEYNKHISKHSATFRNEYEKKTGTNYPKKGNIGYETMRNLRAQWGQGLRKKKGKK